MKGKKGKTAYTAELAGRMYRYFISYEDSGAPSFTKFARLTGLTTADIENFRSHKRFDRAYRECQKIRRDYLTDRALEKRFDPGFVKFLLSMDDENDRSEDSENILLSLEVKE